MSIDALKTVVAEKDKTIAERNTVVRELETIVRSLPPSHGKHKKWDISKHQYGNLILSLNAICRSSPSTVPIRTILQSDTNPESHSVASKIAKASFESGCSISNQLESASSFRMTTQHIGPFYGIRVHPGYKDISRKTATMVIHELTKLSNAVEFLSQEDMQKAGGNFHEVLVIVGLPER